MPEVNNDSKISNNVVSRKNERCLIAVEGGMGKNVMLTSLMPELHKYYDEIYVCSPYFDVFKGCSHVTDAYPITQGSSIYTELVLDDTCDVLWKEPYSNQSFIKKKCHLFEAWAEEYCITLSKSAMDYIPCLDSIDKLPNVKSITTNVLESIGDKYILLQLSGGQSPLTDFSKGNVPYNNINEGIKRNYPYGQELVDLLVKKYPGYKIIHYALPNEPQYNGCQLIQAPFIVYHELAKHAKAIVCIDSSLQHLSVGTNDNMVVIWGETRPEHFGYSYSGVTNLVSKCQNSQPYFKPLGVSPSIVRYPKPEAIIESLK